MNILILVLISLISSSTYASFKVASYNIRNFDYDVRARIQTNKDQLERTILTMSADLLAVQEINQKEIFKNFIENRFNNKYKTVLSRCGGSHEQHLGFVYNQNKFLLIDFKEDLRTSNPTRQHNTFCHEGSRPLAIGKFKNLATNEELVAINVHFKSGGHPRSIEKRFKQIKILNDVVNEYKRMGHKNFIIMGDFNSTEYIYRGNEYKKFNFAFDKMGLVDLSKDVKCTAYWWGGREDGQQHPSILDHIIVSPSLVRNAEKAKATPATHCQRLRCKITSDADMGINYEEVSDHCGLVSELD